ncbi:MAG: HNH endonuclease signature motif containing protein [Rivularia sp. (in: cyanobacteria)]
MLRLGHPCHGEHASTIPSISQEETHRCLEPPFSCALNFIEGNLLEIDHIQPISCGGKKEWKNLQLVHRHCHDVKTANERWYSEVP